MAPYLSEEYWNNSIKSAEKTLYPRAPGESTGITVDGIRNRRRVFVTWPVCDVVRAWGDNERKGTRTREVYKKKIVALESSLSLVMTRETLETENLLKSLRQRELKSSINIYCAEWLSPRSSVIVPFRHTPDPPHPPNASSTPCPFKIFPHPPYIVARETSEK